MRRAVRFRRAALRCYYPGEHFGSEPQSRIAVWALERTAPVSWVVPMNKVFLSCSFREQDRELVTAVEGFLKSLDVQPITGDALGGSVLTSAIMDRIEQCDALIALATPRDRLTKGKFNTHPWVRDELNHARGRKMLAIAVVEKSVDMQGAYQEHERINYDPDQPLPAFIKLAQTVGLWRQQSWRKLRVRLLPDSLSTKLGSATCEYRFTSDGRPTPWREAGLIHEVGGTVAWLNGAQEDSLVELRVSLGGGTWSSRAVPQWIHVKLEKQRRP